MWLENRNKKFVANHPEGKGKKWRVARCVYGPDKKLVAYDDEPSHKSNTKKRLIEYTFKPFNLLEAGEHTLMIKVRHPNDDSAEEDGDGIDDVDLVTKFMHHFGVSPGKPTQLEGRWSGASQYAPRVRLGQRLPPFELIAKDAHGNKVSNLLLDKMSWGHPAIEDVKVTLAADELFEFKFKKSSDESTFAAAWHHRDSDEYDEGSSLWWWWDGTFAGEYFNCRPNLSECHQPGEDAVLRPTLKYV